MTPILRSCHHLPSVRQTSTTARVTTAADGDESPSPPDIPDGAMLTCSEDGTVRVWDLGVLDGKSAGSGDVHSGRYESERASAVRMVRGQTRGWRFLLRPFHRGTPPYGTV